jgi:predicted RNase H-like HicB family nuclease
MITNYKGYSISVEYDNTAPIDRSYVAFINDVPNVSKHVRYNSEENALINLKS